MGSESREAHRRKLKQAANKRYNERHARLIALRFYDTSDGDIIEKLESVESKKRYIARLIREDLKKNPK